MRTYLTLEEVVGSLVVGFLAVVPVVDLVDPSPILIVTEDVEKPFATSLFNPFFKNKYNSYMYDASPFLHHNLPFQKGNKEPSINLPSSYLPSVPML